MVNTKVICTIGPATNSYEMLEKLFHAGMNVARMNMSHGDHETHGKVIERIKRLNENIDYPVGILLDTKGPEIRTGDTEVDAVVGEKIEVAVVPMEEKPNLLYIGYPDLIHSVSDGDKITIDNGLINLKVLSKDKYTMMCEVIDGGYIKGRRHVNLPGVTVNLPAITEKDKSDILFGLEQGIDFVALSFVREASNIHEVQALLGDMVGKVKIIAKIENHEGVENVEEIIKAADGIMVARGDLGVEVDIEELPHIQRRIGALCAQHGKRLIIATHLLESMIENPIPTRAEVTDVSNAVYEEADAIMLSGETTVGKYPIRAVEHLVKLARKTETFPGVGYARRNLNVPKREQHVASCAVDLAIRLKDKGILVLTRTGFTADYASNCRPFGLKIYSFTDNPKTFRTMVLNRSVIPFFMPFSTKPEETLHNAFRILRDRGFVAAGEEIVVLSDMQTDEGIIDSIQIRPIP